VCAFRRGHEHGLINPARTSSACLAVRGGVLPPCSPSCPKTRSAALCGLPPIVGPVRHRGVRGVGSRSASVNRGRPVPRRSRSTRFSACRYAMASCCRRWIQPAIRKTKNWNGVASFGGLTAGHDSRRSSPRQRAPRLRTPPNSCPAQFPDSTGGRRATDHGSD